MKKLFYLLIIISLASCQTTKIRNKEYKVSDAVVELGTIGHATSFNNTNNDFSIHALPVINNKIRLNVQTEPFNSDIFGIYSDKMKALQKPVSIAYADSLPKKPEFVTISIMDISGFAEELNAEPNKSTLTYLKNTKKASVVNGIALYLPGEELEKIKSADSFYVTSTESRNYVITAYRQNKPVHTLELSQGVVLAYTLGKFCWSVNEKEQWYIGDIVTGNKSCHGNTKEKIKEKEDVNLFKM